MNVKLQAILNAGRWIESTYGPSELKRVLVTTAAKKFTRCLIENMLTYALGRGLEPADHCTVEAIRKRLVADDYRIRTIILGIVESQPFLNRGIAP